MAHKKVEHCFTEKYNLFQAVFFMAFSTATLLTAAVLSLSVEAPLIRIQKLLLGGK